MLCNEASYIGYTLAVYLFRECVQWLISTGRTGIKIEHIGPIGLPSPQIAENKIVPASAYERFTPTGLEILATSAMDSPEMENDASVSHSYLDNINLLAFAT